MYSNYLKKNHLLLVVVDIKIQIFEHKICFIKITFITNLFPNYEQANWLLGFSISHVFLLFFLWIYLHKIEILTYFSSHRKDTILTT